MSDQAANSDKNSNSSNSSPVAEATPAKANGDARPVATAAGGTQRANRPHPLQLHNDQQQQPRHRPVPNLTLDDLLQLMSTINGAVKAGDFSSTLAQHIFRLCHQLKISGECLEHSHKNDLNRVMVSLRQACCRDNGALGTPCRLKIMEMVELRAMGWRPSLAHSQYYLNRQQPGLGVGLPPGSAPPFGAIPFNPFALPPGMGGEQQNRSGAMTAGFPPPVSTSAGYYVIPASAGLVPAAFIMPPASPLTMAAPPSSAVSPPCTLNGGDVDWGGGGWPRGTPLRLSGRSAAAAAAAAAAGAAQLTPKTPKTPSKAGCREEIVIRNADSGKLMGVRGRRVAIVEELSKTVISFQKVAPGAKERGLSISGDTDESIEHAKALIEETIRRNVSPKRPDGEGECAIEVAERHKAMLQDIEWHTESDGSLRLSCADPNALQMAQDALKQYLQQVHEHRPADKARSNPLTTSMIEFKIGENPHVKGRASYDRSAVLACAASPVSRVPPACLDKLSTDAPEIMRQATAPFDAAQYEIAVAATH